MRAFLEEDPDLTTVIIGALGAVDPLLNPRNRMSLGDLRWLKGVTYEEALRVRKTLLECTKEDLLELLPYLEKLGEEAHIAVVAGKNLLENCGDVLTSSDQII